MRDHGRCSPSFEGEVGLQAPRCTIPSTHGWQAVRQRRPLFGLSEIALGKSVDLTFQQIQKHKRIAIRLPAVSLYEFAHVLGFPERTSRTKGGRR